MEKKILYRLSTLCFLALWACPKSVLAGLQTSLKLQGETLNFEILGQKSWDYDIKRSKSGNQTKVLLTVKGLNQEELKQLKVQNNPFVQSIKILPQAVDGNHTIEFTLKNDKIEAFDYLTDQPSKLIVDFYVNEDMNTSATFEVKPSTEKTATSKKISSNQKLPEKRKPAAVDYLKVNNQGDVNISLDEGVDLRSGLFDGSDDKFKRFKIGDHEINQNAILKGLTNYYLHFPMIDQEYSFWKKMKSNPPDYEIQPQSNEENKQARLLQTLFKKKRTLVLKKTLDWFEKKYPQSEYLELAYYMLGDLLVEDWRKSNKNESFEEAMFNYKQAVDKFPQSALSERTSLLLGFLNLDKKNYLEATRRFNAHVENEKYKNKPSYQYAKLGLAYALSKLKKTDEALKIAQEVEEKASQPLIKAEAAFRKADFQMESEQYQNAHDSYTQALKKYDKLTALFPNSYYNRMEALFRMKRPQEAHQSALDFVQRFPSHEYAPYALTRVGELLEIMGADQSKSTGAYLETHFRYGDNPRTIVARLHLLSTRMKSMKEQELDQTIKKMDELADRSDLENIDQFKATMLADGYARRDNYDKSIEILTKFYQEAPNRKNSDQVTQRIVKNINDQIRYFSQKSQNKKVLETLNKYSDTWIKKQDRIDTDFFEAKAYQSAGACSVAQKKYDHVIGKLLALGQDQQSQFIRANQSLPQPGQVYLAKAQCLYQNNEFSQALTEMQNIKNLNDLSEEEQVQRVYLAAQVYEKNDDIKSSIRYLNEVVRTWKDKPDLVAPSAIKLAELEKKNANSERAIQILEPLVDEKISNDSKIRAYKLLATVAAETQKYPVAIKAYTGLLENFEKTASLAEERFKLGDLYFQMGELKKAEEVWSNFQGNEGGFWNKIAQEKMQGQKWREDYKKYLKRIPATANSSMGDVQ